jgi:hypothetical protein
MRHLILYVSLLTAFPGSLIAQDSPRLNRNIDSIVAQLVAAKEFSGTILVRRAG